MKRDRKHTFGLLMGLLVGLLTLMMGEQSALAAYARIKVKNNTEYPVKIKAMYPGCKSDWFTVKPGKTASPKASRGLCLINKIEGTIDSKTSLHGEELKVVSYTSSGTAFVDFRIEAHGSRYEIFSEQSYKAAKKTNGKSPGFKFVNRTIWPVAVSLSLASCFHTGVVPAMFNGKPGELVVDTGAVWFTLTANIQPDGVDPSSFVDCMKPAVELAGDIYTKVLKVAKKKKGQALAFEILNVTAKQILKKELSELGKEWLDATSVTLHGQYAGYAWPFQCDKMPEYEITGGPDVRIGDDGVPYVYPRKPFKIERINTCGIDMQKASPKEAEAKGDIAPYEADLKAFSPSAGGGLICNDGGGSLTDAYGTKDFKPNFYGLEEGRVFTLKNMNSQQCAAVKGASTSNSAGLEQTACTKDSHKQFTVRAKGGRTFEIYNEASKKCLAVMNASKSEGAEIIQYDCTGTPNSHWKFEPDPPSCRATNSCKKEEDCYGLLTPRPGRFLNRHSGLCLIVDNDAKTNGAKLVQGECYLITPSGNRETNSRWSFN